MADELFPVDSSIPSWKADWPLGFLVLGDWIFSLWAWKHLPNSVPLHGNIAGQVDGWGSPMELLLSLPLTTVVTYALLRACMSWKATSFAASGRFYVWMRWVLVALFPCIHIALLAHALGHPFNLTRYTLLGLALILLVLGNELPRQEPNTMAAPTPESRQAWRSLYRKTGRLLAAGGALLTLTFWMPMKVMVILLLAYLALSLCLPVVWMRNIRSSRPKTEPTTSKPLTSPGLHLVANDGMALCGILAIAALGFWCGFPHPTLWLSLPPLAWTALALESRWLHGERYRVATFLRGWFVLGCCLSLACKVIPNFPLAISIALLLPTGLVGLGQYLASKSPLAELEVWGQGPVLWDAEDPRVLVPKALGIGWSFNFARNISWLLLLAMIGIPFWLATSPSAHPAGSSPGARCARVR